MNTFLHSILCSNSSSKGDKQSIFFPSYCLSHSNVNHEVYGSVMKEHIWGFVGIEIKHLKLFWLSFHYQFKQKILSRRLTPYLILIFMLTKSHPLSATVTYHTLTIILIVYSHYACYTFYFIAVCIVTHVPTSLTTLLHRAVSIDVRNKA